MSYRFASIAALMTVAIAPAAAAQTSAPRTNAPAAAAQSAPTRAGLLRNLDANFKLIDTNGDGTLAAPELAAAEVKAQTRRAATVRTQVEARFTQLDTNKDGQLSKAEFLAVAPIRQPTASNGMNLLTPLDRNKDSRVSLDEYRAPVLTRFDAMDSNKDGSISAAERQAAERAAQASRTATRR